VLSTLVGIAVSDGRVGLSQTLGELLPAYRSSMSRQETAITVSQLLTMSAGFPTDLSAFMGSRDWIDFALGYGLVGHSPTTAS